MLAEQKNLSAGFLGGVPKVNISRHRTKKQTAPQRKNIVAALYKERNHSFSVEYLTSYYKYYADYKYYAESLYTCLFSKEENGNTDTFRPAPQKSASFSKKY